MARPRPQPSPVTRPFWEATAQHRFLLQRCASCQAAIFYPRTTCPTCGSSELRFEDASGRGRVHTFSIARRATHPALSGQEPYVVAIVELDEGPRLMSNITDCNVDDVHIGMPVQVWFRQADEEVGVPFFKPA